MKATNKIGFPMPLKEHEYRRALLPEDIISLPDAGRLVFEEGYGRTMGRSDQSYRAAGAIVADRPTVCACPIICNAKPLATDEYYGPGKTLFGWVHAVQGRAITDVLVSHGMTAIAWEDMFEGGRHAFWRNNEISGEAAVAHACLQWGRLPYGRLAAVIGRGNAAHGVVRALERSGCCVTIYDRKTVGLLRQEIGRYDILVNAVLWDVFRTDHLVYDQDLDRMKPGSLIIDVSCDEHMGIQSSRPTTIADPVYWYRGILHYAVDHTPALYFQSATESISEVVARYISQLVHDEPDQVLEEATVIHKGVILDPRIVRYQHRQPDDVYLDVDHTHSTTH
ncbi:MAG: hypothetical protein IT443_03390 [Phycisphaeraceae bacterium]|nr:hypothetical protein [Phycisphaeraceae bacterium]